MDERWLMLAPTASRARIFLRRARQMSGRRLAGSLLLLALLVLCYLSTRVSTTLSDRDKNSLRNSFQLDASSSKRPRTFGEEISAILDVQAKVLAMAPVNEQIPKGRSREPEDLAREHHGLCFDRSRSIEKGLAFLGFRTRHVFLLTVHGGALAALVSRQIPSHAVTEVLTSRGWLVVDSNSPWISLSRSGQPIAMADVALRARNIGLMPSQYRNPYWHIAGLYSRHGQFFPPYTILSMPEVKWSDFIFGLYDSMAWPHIPLP